MNVLFICKGNRGRSQIAEGYFRHYYPNLKVHSVGTTAGREKHLGEAPPQKVIDIMKEDNIDVSNQKTKAITKKLVNLADRIIILCSKERCPNYLLRSKKVEFWITPDPEHKGIKAMRETRNAMRERIVNMFKTEH